MGDDLSTNQLGDWFANALFWRPQVALLVNQRTFVPVFMELPQAGTLLARAPGAIATVLRDLDVDESFLASETRAMVVARLAPTNDRSVVGVMNDFAFLAEYERVESPDLVALSVRIAGTPIGPLRDRSGFPDRELAAVVAGLSTN